MTLDPGQPAIATNLPPGSELAIEAAWFVIAILALLFASGSDQIALAMAYIAVHATQPPEPPL
ncbi:hypothetical protein [Amycolatopsis lurida]|uniref:hypothetical protein n=1 Tax=Amycolatopsis lurida TaxID=31959 RepID=UPI00365C0C91